MLILYMEFRKSLPSTGWLKPCSIGCTRPTVNEMVVFVVKKKYYDSYICSCCQECFKKKIVEQHTSHYEVVSKVKFSTHMNSMLIKLL